MDKDNFALIVADNNCIAVLGKYVKVMGYQVFNENTGANALETLRKNGDLIKTVIIDNNVPDMDFSDFYIELKKVRPKICCIFAGDGFVAEDQDNLFGNGNVAFLKKPFTFRNLNASLITVYTKELASYGVTV